MGYMTAIEWCHHTLNFWHGCNEAWRDLPGAALLNVSPPADAPRAPECENCYAREADARHLYEPVGHWGAGAPKYRTSEAYRRQPFAWEIEALKRGERHRVFGGSQMDFADVDAPPGDVPALFEVIRKTKGLDWLMLTKRPERLPFVFPWMWAERQIQAEVLDPEPWPNVWAGTSVGSPRSYWRIAKLLEARAALRFLSVEPLLGALDLNPWLKTGKLGWVIVGGESGAKARSAQVDWIRQIVSDCRAHSVPVFVKQMGARPLMSAADAGDRLGPEDRTGDPADRFLVKLPHKGGQIDDFPEDLRIRELPVPPAERRLL